VRLSLAALFLLLAVVAGISGVAGHTLAVMRYRARAMYAEDQAELKRQAVSYGDLCVDQLAQCRAVCETPLAVRMKGK
jgi:hypothetical protein